MGCVKDLIQILGLNVAINQLSMAQFATKYDHTLRRKDGCGLKRALQFKVKGQNKKLRLKKTGG